jgi:hypothetical protein
VRLRRGAGGATCQVALCQRRALLCGALDGAAEPSTGATLTAALWTAAAANGPLTYVDLDGTSYQVYIDDLREEIAEISQRRGIQRVGLVKLVEAA